jgi:hypothetical protein
MCITACFTSARKEDSSSLQFMGWYMDQCDQACQALGQLLRAESHMRSSQQALKCIQCLAACLVADTQQGEAGQVGG